MIRVSVLYPHEPGGRFDHVYYAQQHMPMVKAKLGRFGLRRLEIDKGLFGADPGSPAPFVCIGHLYFESTFDFWNGLSAHGEEIMADVPNYTDLTPQIQVSEVVETEGGNHGQTTRP